MPSRSPIAVLSLLALTHAVAIGLSLGVLLLFRFDPANYFAMFVIPIGALVFGCVGSLGAFPGAWLSDYPPGPTLRNMVVAAAMVAFAVYLLALGFVLDSADPSHPGVLASLARFETESEYVLTRGSRELHTFGEMGRWGYLFVALKFAGAGLGGAAVHGTLRLLPYCSTCGVFNRTREKGSLQFTSFEDWIAEMRQVPEQPWLRARHLLQLPRRGPFSRGGKHSVQVRLRRHECPACNEQHMRERVFVHNGRMPVEEKQLSSAYSWFPDDARSQPKAPPEVVGGPRVFGRKVA